VLVVLAGIAIRFLNHVLELRRIHLRISTEKDYFLLIFRLCVTGSAICPGSTHDSTAFAITSLAQVLSRTGENTLLPGFWISGDEAYACGERIITPCPGCSLSKENDCFNYWQSSDRIFIEQ
jgi:DDE superfamily endonuclease